MASKAYPSYAPKVQLYLPVKITQVYHLCLLWDWEYDNDFASLLEQSCHAAGIALLQVRPDNLETILAAAHSRELYFQALLDRASDTDDRFMPLVEWARARQVVCINHFLLARMAWDKGWMNDRLARAGLATPTTRVLPAFLDQPDLMPVSLAPLGDRFVVKPAHGGGSRGVVLNAGTWEQVQAARQAYPDDQYLLQEFVTPTWLEGRAAWFRVIYSAGQVFPCWWDTATHVYTPVTRAEAERYALWPLIDIVHTIYDRCRLELFSTEIALTPQGCFVVVDYVNDPLDLRLQSKCPDGVPDDMVREIACSLAGFTLQALYP